MMRTSTLTGSLEPTRSNVFSCKHAQQLGLHLQADVADLVEEQRAAVGQLEAADLVAVGAGERALDVAEQLAFQQARRQGGAVDLDERLAGPRAVVVDAPGQQFLAGAALAAEQHGGSAGGHLADQLQQLPHRRAGADDAVRWPAAMASRYRRVAIGRSATARRLATDCAACAAGSAAPGCAAAARRSSRPWPAGRG